LAPYLRLERRGLVRRGLEVAGTTSS